MDYHKSSTVLVTAGGGEVEDIFVHQPGVLVLADDNHLLPRALQLLDELNINPNQDEDERLAEFIARLTYLSFPASKEISQTESNKLHSKLQEAGHTSPYQVAQIRPSVLITGITIETSLEIVANGYEIGRTTSSRTTAMSRPLFRIPVEDESLRVVYRMYLEEMDYAHSFMKDDFNFPSQVNDRDRLELINMAMIGLKATYLVAAAEPSFWQRKLSKRLRDDPAGVERELILVLRRVATALNGLYPDVIMLPPADIQ